MCLGETKRAASEMQAASQASAAAPTVAPQQQQQLPISAASVMVSAANMPGPSTSSQQLGFSGGITGDQLNAAVAAAMAKGSITQGES